MNGERPTLVYDDDCGFCTWAAEWVEAHGEVEIVGFADLTQPQIDRLPENWRDCAHLLTDEAVFSCGAAMEEAFLFTDDQGTAVIRAARELPGYTQIREWTYHFISEHRDWFGQFVPR